MKTETEKEKKKNEEILLREKQLKDDIECIQKNLISGLNKIKFLKEEREEKIEIVKQVAAENKLDYDIIVAELEKMLNTYKILEKEIEEVQNELKLLLEGSYKELLETQKEKAELMEQHKSICEKKEKEYGALLKEMQQELKRIDSKMHDFLLKRMDVFAEVQFGDYEADVGNTDIVPLLKKISETINRKKN